MRSKLTKGRMTAIKRNMQRSKVLWAGRKQNGGYLSPEMIEVVSFFRSETLMFVAHTKDMGKENAKARVLLKQSRSRLGNVYRGLATLLRQIDKLLSPPPKRPRQAGPVDEPLPIQTPAKRTPSEKPARRPVGRKAK